MYTLYMLQNQRLRLFPKLGADLNPTALQGEIPESLPHLDDVL